MTSSSELGDNGTRSLTINRMWSSLVMLAFSEIAKDELEDAILFR
jgi:hypothetical protein